MNENSDLMTSSLESEPADIAFENVTQIENAELFETQQTAEITANETTAKPAKKKRTKQVKLKMGPLKKRSKIKEPKEKVSLKKRLTTMTLFKKNLVGYLINILILIMMSFYIFTGISHLKDLSLSMGLEYEPRVSAIMRIKQLTTQIHLDFEEVMADKAQATTMADIKDYYKEIEFYLDALKDGGEKYDVSLIALEDETELATLRTSLEAYYAFKNVITQRYQNKFQNHEVDTQEIESNFDKSFDGVVANFDALEEMMHEDMNEIRIETEAYAYRFQITTVGVFLITIILSLLIAVFVARNITRPVKSINSLLIDIATGEGDLTKRLSVSTKDELRILCDNYNLSMERIQSLIFDVASESKTFESSSVEINRAMKQASDELEQIATKVLSLSDMIQSNASSTEQATASIQEIASGSHLISDNAKNVKHITEDFYKASQDGQGTLNEAVKAINVISENSSALKVALNNLDVASKDIENIVSIIIDISNRVNLLALNASIEAARAGDAGRGFAVVADEIRKLAEETKLSTEQIAKSISQINKASELALSNAALEQQSIETGVEKIEMTQSVLKQILGSVSDIFDKVDSISTAIEQQSITSEDMAKAMDEISKSSIESSDTVKSISDFIDRQVAVVQETSSQVDLLAEHSQNLTEKAHQFKF